MTIRRRRISSARAATTCLSFEEGHGHPARESEQIDAQGMG